VQDYFCSSSRLVNSFPFFNNHFSLEKFSHRNTLSTDVVGTCAEASFIIYEVIRHYSWRLPQPRAAANRIPSATPNRDMALSKLQCSACKG
jgi:hypothetical protein